MKHRESEQSIQVYPHCYSKPYYELEVWVKTEELKKEDAMQCLQQYGYLPCNISLDCIGTYPTKEQAEDDMETLYDTMRDYPCCFIREKPLCVMMSPGTYIKEWAYEHNLLKDESLVRNYAENDYPFLGRPKGMIKHDIGDIVQAVDDRQAFWGVIGGLPPVYDGQNHGDWTDDQYTVWLAPNQSRRVRAQHVFKSLTLHMPDYVREHLDSIISKH